MRLEVDPPPRDSRQTPHQRPNDEDGHEQEQRPLEGRLDKRSCPGPLDDGNHLSYGLRAGLPSRRPIGFEIAALPRMANFRIAVWIG